MDGWQGGKVCLVLEDGLDHQNFGGKDGKPMFQEMGSADTSTGMVLLY